MPGHEWDRSTEGTKDVSGADTGEDGSSQDGEDIERGLGKHHNAIREGFKEVKLGINGPFTKSKVTSGAGGAGLGLGSSEEEILGVSRHGDYTSGTGSGTGGGGKRDSKRKSGPKNHTNRESGRDREDEEEIELEQIVMSDRQEIRITETWKVTRS